MALTQIADILEPEVWFQYFQQVHTEKSALLNSGIVSTEASFQRQLAGGGRIIDMPFWNDLGVEEPNIGGDTTGAATPLKITASKDEARRHIINQTWQAADIVSSIAGADPVQAIVSRVANYWIRQDQRKLIASLRGLFADNIANDAGDMVKDVYSDVVSGSITDAMRPTATNILDARQTMGDSMMDFTAIAMHSLTYTYLSKANLITFIPNSDGRVRFPTYMGLNVIVDDLCPVVSGTNSPAYWTFLFGAGAIGFAEGSARVPFEYERQALQGNGQGIESLVSRREIILHPRGIKFTSSSVAGNSPTNTELQAAANWDRVFARKHIKLALLRHNL